MSRRALLWLLVLAAVVVVWREYQRRQRLRDLAAIATRRAVFT